MGDNPLGKSNALNDDDVFAAAFVIMVAGYDTTGSLLAFASYQIAKNPEIQERLRQEVEDVIGMSDQLKYEDVQKMNYMDQVLSETLRMYTPVAMLQRVAGRDYKIPGSEVTVPRGSAKRTAPKDIRLLSYLLARVLAAVLEGGSP